MEREPTIRIVSGAYLPLSDPIVVRALITSRYQIDPGYRCNDPSLAEYRLPGASQTKTDPDLICTYASLDGIIDTVCQHGKLRGAQYKTVCLTMIGYSQSDVAEILHMTKQAVSKHLKIAIETITDQAKADWLSVYKDKYKGLFTR